MRSETPVTKEKICHVKIVTYSVLLTHYDYYQVLPKLTNVSKTKKTCDRFGSLVAPPCSLLNMNTPQEERKINQLLYNLSGFEKIMNYSFKNKAYLLQAFTHASYYRNTSTGIISVTVESG